MTKRSRSSRALPKPRVDATVNAQRLLSVINGDWTPYQRTMQCIPWVAPPGSENWPIDWAETDFDLLRHDIHVVYYGLFAHATPRSFSPLDCSTCGTALVAGQHSGGRCGTCIDSQRAVSHTESPQ